LASVEHTTDAPLARKLVQKAKAGLDHLGSMAAPVCIALIVGPLAWRFWLGPLGGLGDLDTRESVVGLMARQLWLGSWPELFVWGSSNLGALEPVGAAAAFSLMGECLPALRAIPFMAWTLCAFFTLLMTARWLGAAAAVAAALLLAVSFPGPTAVTVRALGGLSWGLFCGLVALGACSSLSMGRPRHLSFSAGFFCGVALFAHPALLALSGGAWVSAGLGLMPVLWRPSRLLIAFNHAVRMVAGAALGSAPLWASDFNALRQSLDPFELVLLGEEHGALEVDWLAGSLGGPWAPTLVVILVLASVPGVVVRLARQGTEDTGARLCAGALFTAALSVVGALGTAPQAPDEALLRLLPLLACLPLLAAATLATPLWAYLSLGVGTVLLLVVDPEALPASHEPAAESPVLEVVRYLDQRGPLHCYAHASVAYRVALLSGERHRCVSIAGPDHARAWRAPAASGPRAYFFSVEEVDRLRLFDSDMKRAKLSYRSEVLGPFSVRLTEGVNWPPDSSPVVWEHAKRQGRAVIDGDIATSVSHPLGVPLTIELVWPSTMTSVTYLQDVTALATSPCSVRGGVRTSSGRMELGQLVQLTSSCELARRWGLWPSGNLEVKVPLPAKEAVAVTLESADERPGSLLTVSEARVQPRTWRRSNR
jgi:hypothetical protein